MNEPTAPRRTTRNRIRRWMYRHGWTTGRREGSVLHRLHDLVARTRPWYDWGHPLMVLVGRYDSGDWGPPRVRDLWFRKEYVGKHQRFETTRDSAVVRERNDGEWRIFDGQDDGHTIEIGFWPHPDSPNGQIHRTGLDGRGEIQLFARWLIWDGWIKAEWFGLRRWLYYRGLHNAVEPYVPFTCRVVPERGSGGYTHWHCDLRPRHKGDHRYRNYTWPGPGTRVQYAPQESPTPVIEGEPS